MLPALGTPCPTGEDGDVPAELTTVGPTSCPGDPGR
jgi:hypothetical protein